MHSANKNFDIILKEKENNKVVKTPQFDEPDRQQIKCIKKKIFQMKRSTLP